MTTDNSQRKDKRKRNATLSVEKMRLSRQLFFDRSKTKM